MPTFREILKKTIPSKTQRLLDAIGKIIGPRKGGADGQRQRNIFNFLRDNQRVQGFAQPGSFDMRKYQTRGAKLFDRIVSSISKFIRGIGQRSSAMVGAMSPSTRQFRAALESVIERSRSTMIDAARDLISSNITPSQFRQTLVSTIRSLHLTAAFIGLRSTTNASMNTLEDTMARIDKQLSFVDDFTQDIQEILDKNQGLTQKQAETIVNSASKYADAARSTHSNAERLFVEDTYGTDVNDDRVLAMRVLGANENHCFVCPDLAGTWEELDDIVPIGDSPCGPSGCKCTIIYARASEIAGETLPVDTLSEIL